MYKSVAMQLGTALKYALAGASSCSPQHVPTPVTHASAQWLPIIGTLLSNPVTNTVYVHESLFMTPICGKVNRFIKINNTFLTTWAATADFMAFTCSCTLRPAAAVTYAISSSFSGAIRPAATVTYAISSSFSGALRPAAAVTYAISSSFSGTLRPAATETYAISGSFSGTLSPYPAALVVPQCSQEVRLMRF